MYDYLCCKFFKEFFMIYEKKFFDIVIILKISLMFILGINIRLKNKKLDF